MNKTARIILIASLVLNVLLIGIIIGHVSHKMSDRFSLKKHPFNDNSMPEESKKLFTETMRKIHKDKHKIDKKIRDHREKIIAILTAESFNKEIYLAETQKLHDLKTQMMEHFTNNITELASKLSQEERVYIAEHLRRPPPPPPPGFVRPPHR